MFIKYFYNISSHWNIPKNNLHKIFYAVYGNTICSKNFKMDKVAGSRVVLRYVK